MTPEETFAVLKELGHSPSWYSDHNNKNNDYGPISKSDYWHYFSCRICNNIFAVCAKAANTISGNYSPGDVLIRKKFVRNNYHGRTYIKQETISCKDCIIQGIIE